MTELYDALSENIRLFLQLWKTGYFSKTSRYRKRQLTHS